MAKVVLKAVGRVDVYDEGSSWDLSYKGKEVFKCTEDGKWTSTFGYTTGSSGSGDGGGGHGGTPGNGNVYSREERKIVGGTWTKVDQAVILHGDFTCGDNMHASLKDLNENAQKWARVPLNTDGCYVIQSSDSEIPGFACFAIDNYFLAGQMLKIKK